VKRTHATGVIVASLVALCGASASSDEGTSLAEGTRVRVTAQGFASRPVIGDLIAVEATRVALQRAGSSEVVAIPLSDVTRFEVSTRRRRKGRGARIGALVGLGVGAAVGYAAGDDCGAPDAPSIVCISRPSSAAAVGLAGAGLGAVLGLLLAPRETVWETVNPHGLQVSVVPSAGRTRGLGLAMSLRF
jgi:hypothetical protein